MSNNTTLNAARSIATQAIIRAADRPDNGLRPHEAGAVARAVVDDIAPVILHATNNEPWYKSRVTWGAIGAIVIPLLTFAGISSDIITPDEFVAGGVALGGIVSGGLTLYGRWKARKPIA